MDLSEHLAELSARSRALDPWLRRLPLLGPAAGMWAGSAIAGDHATPWALPLAILGAGCALLSARPIARAATLFALALGTGALGGRLAHESPRCPPVGEKRQAVGEVLRVSPEPDGRVSLDLRLEAVGESKEFTSLRCHALLSTGRRAPQVIEGDTVWIPPTDWEPVAHLYNPGSDTAEGLETRGIDRVASLPDGAGLLPLAHGSRFARAVGHLRRRVRERLARLPASSGREVLQAVTLGERSTLSSTTRDAFLDSGLRHFLTDGTLYLALVLFLALAASRTMVGRIEPLAVRWPVGRVAAAMCLPLPACYAAVTGGWPAAARASMMATLWLGARALGRGRPSALHLMSAALVLLLGLAPSDSRDPGLWLSVAALVFIAAAVAPLLRRLAAKETGRTIAARFAAAAVVAAAIWLATLPILAEENQRLSYLGFPASLLGLPLGLALASCAATILALAALGASAWALPLQAGLLCAQALASLAAGVAPYSRWILRRPSALALAGYAALLVGLALMARRSRRGIPVLCVGALATAGWGLLPGLEATFGRAPLRLTFLSVGQGDGVVIELPDGETLVLDAGGSPVGSFDPGERVVAPYLWSRGHTRIDVMALSHPHPDHANGLPYLMSAFEVGELWQSGEPCPLPACEELERLSLAHGVARHRLGTAPFRRSWGPVELVLLWPKGPLGYDPSLGENDNSLVFRLTYGSFSALLPGDIEASAEEALVASGVDLGVDVLKAPHHGSDTSSTAAFLERVHPRDVVFSVGPRNRFGFPRASVVSRYEARGTRIQRTDLDGAVTITSDGTTTYRVETAAPPPH